jgi:hypothetical protein
VNNRAKLEILTNYLHPLAFLKSYDKMRLHSVWRYYIWLIRSMLTLALAAVPAQTFAPPALSARVMPLTSSTPALAWTAAPAATPAPTALSLLSNQQTACKTKILPMSENSSGVFLCNGSRNFNSCFRLAFRL